jgi:threonine/homoserine/homoserine lactone efflux protein
VGRDVTDVLASVLPLALVIAASPFAIVPAILMLMTARPRATGSAFLLGWVTGLLAVTFASAWFVDGANDASEPETWTLWLRIGVGAALVLLGVKQWLTRGRSTKDPRWMAAMAGVTPRRAASLGALLAALNPKVLLLAVAAGTTIGAQGLPRNDAALAAALFVAVASIGVAVPVIVYFVAGQRAVAGLQSAQDWLKRNNDAVTAVVLILIGLALAAAGATDL